jgi:hypothetical protein
MPALRSNYLNANPDKISSSTYYIVFSVLILVVSEFFLVIASLVLVPLGTPGTHFRAHSPNGNQTAREFPLGLVFGGSKIVSGVRGKSTRQIKKSSRGVARRDESVPGCHTLRYLGNFDDQSVLNGSQLLVTGSP